MALIMREAFTVLSTIAIMINLANAANHVVGGPNGGWDATSPLRTWAASHTFSVGDSLVFQYSINHDILEVTKAEYDSCQSSNPIQSYNGGNTLISLTSPGKRYFICGTPGHCTAGMKIEVDTLATTTAPSVAPTPSPSSLDSPATVASPVSSTTLSPEGSVVIAPESPSAFTPMTSPPSPIQSSPSVIPSDLAVSPSFGASFRPSSLPPPLSSAADINSFSISFVIALYVAMMMVI